MSKVVTKRKKRIGGLHISLFVNDEIEISHNGETIRLIYVGNTGFGQIGISANGPRSFEIKSTNLKQTRESNL